MRAVVLIAGLFLAACHPVVQVPEKTAPPPVEATTPEVPPFVEPTPLPEPTPEPPKITEATVLPAPTATPAVTVNAPLFAGPEPPALSPTGYQLILNFEVGGGAGYYNKRLARPSWPGLHSGVTVGIGVDLGYNSRRVVLSDWQELPGDHPERLAATSGITGQKARAKAQELHDILIKWETAEGVFQRVTISKFYDQTRRAMPGFDGLRPNAQAALVSLVFNRGPSMIGANRVEMRAIRDAVPSQDYAGIAAELRKMVRIWRGTPVEIGLTRRRIAEAKLIESP